MKVQETLRKPMTEAKYLNVDNTDRYRPIIRLFYLQYEKLKYWLYQEDVYEALKEDKYFEEYTPEQCQQDLSVLTSWGNLVTIQDTKKAASIEEFKNKKFRYQLSDVCVEIERMVMRVENLSVEGSSLEPTLLERLRMNIEKLESMLSEEDDAVYGWWHDLNSDFVRLNQNYQDYMRELNSVKAEQMMQTQAFLVFKDRLIEYLRTFVQSLQMNVTAIEDHLRQMDPSVVGQVLERVTACEMAVPRIDMDMDRQRVAETMRGRWESIVSWFYGDGSRASEAAGVFDMTNEIIRKITRYAARISEMNNSGANRREEYYKLAVMFSKCQDIFEAHRLSAMVFGIEKPLHFKGDFQRETQSIHSGVYDEKPWRVTVTPRVRGYREKAERSSITEHSEEKAAARQAVIEQMVQEGRLLKSYIQGRRLDFSALPVIEPRVRDIFLLWLSKALENKNHCGKTEEGKKYFIENMETKETCTLHCTDGDFLMPAYVIVFEEDMGD